jgi:hypothetical protein
MATVLKGFTTEEQRPVVSFLWAKGLNPKDCVCVCRVKRFTTGSRNSLKDVRKSQMMPDQVRKWLRQRTKDLYAAGFDALVKRWDKCIKDDGGYADKYIFSRFEYHMFWVLYRFVTYLLTLPRTFCEK